ncbi:MAG: GGDEF domain-containing protein, partial [Candidatus Eremiobacteraeota bacterium]|nr:GGDEF domain-containing protein [Candidatus Eremiobacteraeota bacterium]
MMRRKTDPRLAVIAAFLFAFIGAAWLLATAFFLPLDPAGQLISAATFIVFGTAAMYVVLQRGVVEQRAMLEELLGLERRASQRRQRLDILWRFAGSDSADFESHANAALEFSARVLGMDCAEVGHAEGDVLVYDLFHALQGEAGPGDRLQLAVALGALPIAAGKLVDNPNLLADRALAAHPQVAEGGARAFIGAPFWVGNTQYELGFYSRSARQTPFDEEDHEYVQVLAAFFAGLFRQRRGEQEMAQLALFDGLTGLPNRANLLDQLRGSIASHRRRDAQCALLVMNLNRFKQVNDAVGHAAGDRVLLEIASRLKHVRRSEDSLARVGGDQFAIVTSLMKSPAEVVALAERMRSVTAEPVIV